jgi:dual specificity protein kinase YAK1
MLESQRALSRRKLRVPSIFREVLTFSASTLADDDRACAEKCHNGVFLDTFRFKTMRAILHLILSRKQDDQNTAPSPRRLRRFLTAIRKKFGIDLTSMAASRECLTEPAEPASNNGLDNIEDNLIVYTGDVIIDPGGPSYCVTHSLGKGEFGQVFAVTLLNAEVPSTFALKITKSGPSHRQQTMHEIAIMERLKATGTAAELETVSQIIDHFGFHNHICIRMQVLSDNFLSLLDRRGWHGLGITLIQSVTKQLVQALCLLQRAEIVHLDLKPENIVLADLYSQDVKVIDFGSSRLIGTPVPHYYVQSRWYRAPEVVLRLSAGFEADMWSLGVTIAELFLATPMFPAPNEFQLLAAFVDKFGPLPRDMVEQSPRREELFDQTGALKTAQQMCREHGIRYEPVEDYYTHEILRDTVLEYTPGMGQSRMRFAAERAKRSIFADFVEATMKVDPQQRITAIDALSHPFLTATF